MGRAGDGLRRTQRRSVGRAGGGLRHAKRRSVGRTGDGLQEGEHQTLVAVARSEKCPDKVSDKCLHRRTYPKGRDGMRKG